MKLAALIVASLAVACCASPFGDFFDRLDDFRGKIHDRIVDDIKKFSDRLNLDQSIRERFQDIHDRIDELAKNSTAIRNCFESEFNGFDFNIFNSSLDFATISSVYYSAFPEKEMDDTSIQTLIESVRDIFEKCLSGRFGQARFGFTSLSDMTDDQISAMNGAIPGDRFNASQSENRFARAASGKDAVCHRDGNLPSSFDWRQHGAVTPVKNQGGCPSCWAFASTASMESAYLIHKKTNNQNFDLSEQQIVDCAQSDGCSKGGFAYTAMGYIQRNGQTSEQNWPYSGKGNNCPGGKQVAARLPNFCVRSIYYYGEGLQTENLSDDDIRKALVFFGPLYITFNTSPIDSRNYRGGVLSDPNCPKLTNHAVTLVGYTPNAWIIKNSWGGKWGDQGYLYMARGSNMCGINTEIAYPLIN